MKNARVICPLCSFSRPSNRILKWERGLGLKGAGAAKTGLLLIKELKLSYHNGYMFLVNNRVSAI